MLIAIAGGIGSGKSVVSRILRVLGYPVYDCDTQARIIMDGDQAIHSRLCSDIHPQAVVKGVIDRPLISSIVFNDSDALLRLNAIVHTAVTADLRSWSETNAAAGRLMQFVETAIPVQSGLYRQVDAIWQVVATEKLRIRRVQIRNGLTERQVRDRMDSQRGESLAGIPHIDIHNDTDTPLLPQIHRLLDSMEVRKRARKNGL